MLVEMQVWQLRPGEMAKLEPLLDAALKAGNTNPADIWRAEFGALDRVISFWAYEDALARSKRDNSWRAGLDEHIVEEQLTLLIPAPFSPAIGPCEIGKVYEIWSYNYRAGGLQDIFERWGATIDERALLSPFIGAWYADVGQLNQWVHVWTYKDLLERERAVAVSRGVWPPKNKPGTFLRQENMLVTPFLFSPMR